MEQVMALRIFDHLLVNHGWNATGGIYPSATHVTTDDHANPANEISAAERAEIERRSLLARLTHRCKLDPTISRAARRLQADPWLPIRQLAAEIGVSERYLSSGLQGALGENLKHRKPDGS
jgi:AraC-like DNA-binding protein